jgi:hypothetical protein
MVNEIDGSMVNERSLIQDHNHHDILDMLLCALFNNPIAMLCQTCDDAMVIVKLHRSGLPWLNIRTFRGSAGNIGSFASVVGCVFVVDTSVVDVDVVAGTGSEGVDDEVGGGADAALTMAARKNSPSFFDIITHGMVYSTHHTKRANMKWMNRWIL